MGVEKSPVARPAGRRYFPFHECTNSCGSKIGGRLPHVLVDERPGRDAVVVRLMVLESEVRDLVAQRVQKLEVREMVRAEQRVRFHHQ